MADTQETIADIIAEMRNRAKRPDFVSQDVLKSCADRLDAARKREAAFHAMTCEANDRLREHLQIALDADKRERGDCAKLREALENLYDQICHGETEQHVAANRQMIRAALSTPPRKCDLPEVAKDPWRAWLDDKSNWDEFGSPKLEILDWLLALSTEKEGGNDGNE